MKKVKIEKVNNKGKTSSPGKDREEAQELGPKGQLTVDVFQTDKEFVVVSPVAGVGPEDIEVFIDNDMLVIRGKRQKAIEETAKDYFYQECFWGSFERQVILPEDINSTKLTATLEKGVLTVKAPRVKRVNKKTVKVESLDDD